MNVLITPIKCAMYGLVQPWHTSMNHKLKHMINLSMKWLAVASTFGQCIFAKFGMVARVHLNTFASLMLNLSVNFLGIHRTATATYPSLSSY